MLVEAYLAQHYHPLRTKILKNLETVNIKKLLPNIPTRKITDQHKLIYTITKQVDDNFGVPKRTRIYIKTYKGKLGQKDR